VLGTIISNRSWSWTAYGKHPAAKDYFQVGKESPLIKVFLNWVATGYKEFISKKGTDCCDPAAWRFWAKGIGKDNLICGLIKDSSDSLGRNYPFLIIGVGPLKDWENQWDLLPFACERVWGQAEYLSTQKFDDFEALETEVQNIIPPDSEWSELDIKRKKLLESIESQTCKASSQKLETLNIPDAPEYLICLEPDKFCDQFTLINYWHLVLKRHYKGTPNAMFMGGKVNRSYMACFKRPLINEDFVRLWLTPSERASDCFIKDL
jgi:type VI secretion system protein VasJ